MEGGVQVLQDQIQVNAVEYFREAIRQDSSYAQAHHWLGVVQILIGRLEKAREHHQLAVDLAPGLAGARTALIATLIGEGNVEALFAALTTEQELSGALPLLALAAAPVVELCRPGVGVGGDPLGGLQLALVLDQRSDPYCTHGVGK